jgi:hypothetical protein
LTRNPYPYFDIQPRILRSGQVNSVTIRPLYDHVRFTDGTIYQVTLQPLDSPASQAQTFNLEARQGVVSFQAVFPLEGEYILLLNSNLNERERGFARFHLYALDNDLFQRRPFKGDIHMHSHYSDGFEAPAYVAACCRRIGLDFMAITDHARYAPSLEAIATFFGKPIDLRIYPGEEVHSPDNPTHIVNFGGDFSINALFDSETYRDEVRMLVGQLPPLNAGVDRKAYASCLWTFDKIRQAGGLGVFCHPYWVSVNRFDNPAALTELLLQLQPFDALELIGGFYPFESESNHLQVTRYHEARSRGKRFPIVGVSDAHGCERGELFGWYYTIVFSASLDLPNLIQSIKDLYSVAVEAMPNQPTRTHGPFRLVRYAQFLLREVFPQLNELYAEEGRLMLAYIAGDEQAMHTLQRLQGRIQAKMETLFSKQAR